VIFRIANDHDLASTGHNFVVLRDALGGVIRTLGVKVGPDFPDDCAHVFFRKNKYRVDICERGENFCPLVGGHQWAAFAFQCTDGVVAVDGNHKLSAQLARRVKVANVADVEQIEASIGERDAMSGAAPCRHALAQIFATKDF